MKPMSRVAFWRRVAEERQPKPVVLHVYLDNKEIAKTIASDIAKGAQQ